MYKEGRTNLSKLTGFYKEKTENMLTEIEDKFIHLDYGCACGDQQSVIKELNLFLDLNQGSQHVEKVNEGLNTILKGKSKIKFECVGGQ
ncbi:MAG: hypothetical protein V1872_12655 [bacterium]